MKSDLVVLIVKGQNSQFEKLVKVIEEQGYSYDCVESSTDAVKYLSEKYPVLILSDLLIDRKDAIDIMVESNRKQIGAKTKFVVFSDRREHYVEIAALKQGADDFLVKPVNKRVFASRLEAWMRWHKADNGIRGHLSSGNLFLDNERFLAVVKGREIALQRKEFEIMSLLFSQPGKVYSRPELKSNLWTDSQNVRDRTIDVHIRNLRGKLGAHYIKTYKGVGYSFAT
jgi:two-component system alkaline phosphatase synthesis response regulator PhoP